MRHNLHLFSLSSACQSATVPNPHDFGMLITLPFSTPITNVLRFLLIEYIILKLFNKVTEALAKHLARHTYLSKFQEHWPGIFLVPYRLRHTTLPGKLIPFTIALFINAFLLSTEFAFSSTSTQHQTLDTRGQELSVLSDNEPVSFSSLNWIARVEAISRKCVTRHSERNAYQAVGGFIRDKSVFGSTVFFEAPRLEIICFDDPRLNMHVNRVLMNITHSVEHNEDGSHAAEANLTVLDVKKEKQPFGFVSGDVDIRVRGNLTISLPHLEHSVYSVRGGCTGFTKSDRKIYCYLTDGARRRFILPSSPIPDSDVDRISNVSVNNILRLSNSGPFFLANVWPYDNYSRTGDGDHLAAIKSFVTTFAPRKDAEQDPSVAQLYYPIVRRSFYIATVLGATSFRKATVEIEVQSEDINERAQVSLWALVMICLIIGLLLGLLGLVWVYERRYQRWNVPVTYNELAEMVIDECYVNSAFSEGGWRRILTCGLRDDGFVKRYRPVDPSRI